ncbi:alpha/beta fold hydrolase [Nocardia seriolae]|nr:alpha/beta hydrolase [Nocardia seriolae]MTJ63871.1 alpha/beta fold hydrolase [Nocardia seriolae]MTJ71470.1 alpha/beta fold hydrolase [Nocardia seriolae]MTJ88430.1 alpha/beta fold hydrolase [Nocardia seriolae]MTK32416.1 alpha/beta fold hydrolase [Nocardia seriolae]MTK41762.1 alpha/beta fold hydrolase [Nocardia seriolae]
MTSDLLESTRTLRRDGLTLTARHFGPAGAPMVMLLHGFPDTPHTWDGLIPRLVAAGFQVLAPWLRGYTPGSASRSARYDPMAVSADVAAWHRELGGPPTHLVGHDWGAFAAMILAKQDPGRWESLTLLAIPPFGGGLAPGMWRWLPRQLVLSSYIPVMQSGYSPRLLTRRDAAFVRGLWRRWSPGWAFTDAEFAPTAAVFTDATMAWAATRYYRSLFTVGRSATREFNTVLLAAAAPLPTLALAGSRDGCMSPPLQRVLAEHAGARHAQLPGCGHFLQAERPDAVAQWVIPHLRAARAPR